MCVLACGYSIIVNFNSRVAVNELFVKVERNGVIMESPDAVQRVLLCVSRLYNDQERRKARKEYPGGVLKTTTPQNDPRGMLE